MDTVCNKVEIHKNLYELGLNADLYAFRGENFVECPARVHGAIGNTSVGMFSYVQSGSIIDDTDIGRFCSIASNVVMGAGEHPVDWLSTHPFVNDPHDVAAVLSPNYPAYKDWLSSKSSRIIERSHRRVSIGHDVWVGHGAFIRRGVIIGHGAIIAAKAVVTRNVEPYAIVGGSPAKPLRFRFQEMVRARLLRLCWWNYDLSVLATRIDFSEVTSALDLIESEILLGKLPLLQPKRFRITSDGASLMA